jgi:hypothetical protein
MSFPTIPHISPSINLNRAQVVDLLLASIAFEELGLAHIINAEGEKLQAALGTLPSLSITAGSLTELVTLNREVRRTLETVIKSQMLLQFKLEDVLDIKVPKIPVYVKKCSAWAAGFCYGHRNAQYTTLSYNERERTVELELERKSIDVGNVHLLRKKNILAVTLVTDSPYVMDQVHLIVNNTVPSNSDPTSFPYQYTVTDPSDYFTTYTFNIDVSAFAGDTLYVAAHADILQEKQDK